MGCSLRAILNRLPDNSTHRASFSSPTADLLRKRNLHLAISVRTPLVFIGTIKLTTSLQTGRQVHCHLFVFHPENRFNNSKTLNQQLEFSLFFLPVVGNKGFDCSKASVIQTKEVESNHLGQGKTKDTSLEEGIVELGGELEDPKPDLPMDLLGWWCITKSNQAMVRDQRACWQLAFLRRDDHPIRGRQSSYTTT